ncbi:ribosome small subunit-dependent GTPase A [Acidaminococcus fermentans]|uniref:ribosome small subunit-dependent GTPase A n=1 Tax=Acidaminococcus fermentans TaxID=905 RepID=UPI00242D8C78|nr:ribosome small subunit-dependent GTPase A [Acidaminococcus fermentans]MCI6285393.1 ribosome small subunit-dependent GTPase A [Acidaminococcus fermentans]
MSTATGRIIKTYNGYYYVAGDDGVLYTCKVKGRMKQKRFIMAAGDRVELEAQGAEGMIRQVLPRQNLLQRPLVANLDCLMAVFACGDPDPSFLLVDKLLALAEAAGIPAALVLNKRDLAPAGLIDRFRSIYEPLGYPVLPVEAREGLGLEPILERVKGHTVAFGGPSGAGKSTLLNHLDPSLTLKTGHVSSKIGRGRHTTRFAELLPFAGGYIVDTPGFGNIDLSELQMDQAADGFREIRKQEGLCRFTGCTHTHEPDCEVKAAVERGKIAPSRYASYCTIRQELADPKKRGKKS